MSWLQSVLTAGEQKRLQHLRAVVPLVNGFESEIAPLDDESLARKTLDFRQRLRAGASLDDLLPEVFAVVREVAHRVTGQRHFDVQLLGGAALHLGWVAEMRTGEGKTLTATLSAYLNALDGRGVHVVTVNDYLAERDAIAMGRVYGFLGLSTGLVTSTRNTDRVERQRQYQCDVTYGVNAEIGFDYLRDNMVVDPLSQVHRGFSYALIDEVDSVLIDEARTPLLISSGEEEDSQVPYLVYAQTVAVLEEGVDFEVHEMQHSVILTDPGIDKVASRLGIDNLFEPGNENVAQLVSAALKARCLYTRDKDYVVVDDRVVIVDAFTGRLLEGRRWGDGLHQAVEAKEGVPTRSHGTTMATVSLQNLFRMYDKLSGMTGTAMSSAAEFRSTYGLEVVAIPTNRPVVRIDHPDKVFHCAEEKWDATVDEIAMRHRNGQPVLVGTTSVAHSEHLSSKLFAVGIPHHVLNAKQASEEALVVANAGRFGAVTVATNMAGRGVDIILGGDPRVQATVRLLTEGFPAEVVGSLGDRSPTAPVPPLEMRILRDEAVKRFDALVSELSTECTDNARRVVDVGGLCVIGTERHESRRIDDQLRGRSGRQGDPGESMFFVSLEDELLARYTPGSLEWADEMKQSGRLEAGVVITDRKIARAVDAAQAAVELRDVQVRKHLVDFDEVLDQQRKVFYARRAQVISGTDLKSLALGNIAEAIFALHAEFTAEGAPLDATAFVSALGHLWPTQVRPEQLEGIESPDGIEEAVLPDAALYYEGIELSVGSDVMRDIERHTMVQLMDANWRAHLTSLEALQDAVFLRSAGLRNPLDEWRRESFELFSRMMRRISLDFVRFVMHVRLVHEDAPILADAIGDAAGNPDGPGR